MSTNHTPNYQLNQWERSDKVLMDDFNADNAKLDAALAALAEADGAEASARLALAAQVAGKGNCKIYVAACHSFGFIPLPGKPVLMFVVDENVQFILASPRLSKAMRYTPGAVASGSVATTWSDSGLLLGSESTSTAPPTSFLVAFYAL